MSHEPRNLAQIVSHKTMITEERAKEFSEGWIASWNAHDIERIMSYYAENVEYYSPFVVKLTGIKSGMLQGKAVVKEYLSKGLEAYPDLHFVLDSIFVGITSISLKYQTVNSLTAFEVFEFDDEGLVNRVQCHHQI